jgi:hypothetical protein
MGFSEEGLLGIRAFGYTGFSVVTPYSFGTVGQNRKLYQYLMATFEIIKIA